MNNLKISIRIFILSILFSSAFAVLKSQENLSEDDIKWRLNTGYNPQVHGTVSNSGDSDVFARVPYAYYPYSNEIEIGFDYESARKLLPPDDTRNKEIPTRLNVAILNKKDNVKVADGTIKLDLKGRGHGYVKLPELPDGIYQVEYEFNGVKLLSSRTFRRTHFGFEKNNYGLEHKVYAPFTPVEVKGQKVSVVGRTYTINSLGLFDSVVANGKELLAEPMKIICNVDGKNIEWKSVSISGKVLYPDLAVFNCEAKSIAGTLKSKVSIEEDGFTDIVWDLIPNEIPVTIQSLKVEMSLKDSEAPLCHLIGMNSMRHNYAGKVPRGGNITWYNQPWRPARWEVAAIPGALPPSYQVWESNNQMHWGSQRWNFAPYIWLGAEERGLAWCGDNTRGYSTDGKTSLQRLFIEYGKVVLRVEIIQVPILVDKTRHIEFGLQASPTKPMRSDWRGYDVPGGGGMPVVVWGGFNCSSKYPVEKEWGLVDKIVAGRGSGKVDNDYFKGIEEKYKLQNATANSDPWIKSVLHFAGKEATNPHPNGTTVYFEEHQTNGNHPEMVEYMDEWADTTWSRFRYFEYSGYQEGLLQKGTWGPEVRSANALSYQDFAVYTASQWMERGVGIYYDNTYPMVDYNRVRLRDNGINWSNCIWGHRAYYKRVWKRSRELMEKGLTPLDPLYSKTDPTRRMSLNIVGHVTNCQVLPYTTWFDATLGVESPGQWIPDKMPSDEQKEKSIKEWSFVILPTPNKDASGTALPYSPDYLRAMEMGRMAGLIPHYRHLLRSEDAFGGIGIGFGATNQGKEKDVREHRYLSDAGMGLIHEIRGGASGYDHPQVGALRRAMKNFGYGKKNVKVYNYWEEKPFVSVNNPQVKWLAMTREDKLSGLLLLQSYSPDIVKTSVKFPEGAFFIDALTREQFTVNNKGEAEITLTADYGTRLLLIAKRQQDITLMSMTPQTLFIDDFELGLGPDATIKGEAVSTIEDLLAPGNRVLHLTPAHPAQNIFSTLTPISAKDGDYTATFKFRLSEKPNKAGKQGLIRVGYRHLNNMRYGFEINADISADGKITFFLEAPRLVYDGGKSQPMQVSNNIPGNKISGNQNLDATDWHIMLIRVIGKRHQLAIDGKIIFDGEDDTCMTGGLELAPGWGLTSKSPVPSVDIDKIWIQKTTDDKQMTVTCSWDDGHKNDVKLTALLKKYNAKGTFFIYPENYVLYKKDPEAGLKKDPFLITPHEDFINTYKGFEIGAHGFQHPDMRKLKPEELEYQLTESKKVLEEWFKTPVSGMAYPGGAYNDDVKTAVKKAGYKYARTVESASTISTNDPYALKVSLKYSDSSFWKEAERIKIDGGIFYFWGHSYEIKNDDEWREIEDKIARLSADPSIKWVTNADLFKTEDPAKQ